MQLIQADIQSHVQAVIVGILTDVPMPNIINDWIFVLLKDDNLKQTTDVFIAFQSELMKMKSTKTKSI